jgi:hypothetical protein
MQTTLMARSAMNKIKGGAFQPPFPDHYALNSLLLTARSWVFVPQKLLVVGVSPKSFGHFVYSDKQEEGKKYLGIDSNFKGRLPGTELNNGMVAWLTLLKMNFAEQLSKTKISRTCYVRHQVYSWIFQVKSKTASTRDLLGWARLLSLRDWMSLATIIFEKKIWERLFLMLRHSQKSKVENLWRGALPLENIADIKEFSDWICSRQKHKVAVQKSNEAQIGAY